MVVVGGGGTRGDRHAARAAAHAAGYASGGRGRACLELGGGLAADLACVVPKERNQKSALGILQIGARQVCLEPDLVGLFASHFK